MLAEVVTIGDEVCRGEIVDSNSAFLAGSLWDLDVTVAWMSSCRDVAADIDDAIRRAAQRTDLVVVSGGLGPTSDDLTVDVVSSLIGAPPVIDPAAKARMDARLARSGFRAPNMDRQVRVPRGARVFDNEEGLAPAFEVTLDGTPIICLPGPPRELQPIVKGPLAQRITEIREAQGAIERIARRVYRVFGRGESQVAAMLEGFCEDVPGASLHYQAKSPEVLVKVVVRDRDGDAARERLAELDAELRERLGPYLYGIDDDSLAGVVGATLRAAGMTLATAESCTGGLIGALLTDVPGSSDYYLGGAVTYANSEKVRQLGVSSALLDTHGAVSEECVLAMAEGVRERTRASVGVAVSGVAGPSGGTDDKPVGTVWIAVCGPGAHRRARKLYWPSSRERIRTLSSFAALGMVLRAVRGEAEVSQ